MANLSCEVVTTVNDLLDFFFFFFFSPLPEEKYSLSERIAFFWLGGEVNGLYLFCWKEPLRGRS